MLFRRIKSRSLKTEGCGTRPVPLLFPSLPVIFPPALSVFNAFSERAKPRATLWKSKVLARESFHRMGSPNGYEFVFVEEEICEKRDIFFRIESFNCS
jgi:hypothetical protein